MSDVYLGTIISAGASVNNLTTATPFAVERNLVTSLQPDVAVYVQGGADSTTVATANGVRVDANQLYDVRVGGGESALAILPVAGGAANVKVFRKG